MSTDKRPGMAINEERADQLERDTRKQAEQAQYPRRPVPLHGRATAKHARRKKPLDKEPEPTDSE